jgi:hypothetical protein
MSSAKTITSLDGVITDLDTGLRQLIASGYQFVHPRDARGEVVEIVGIRVHDHVVDVVRLNAEDDAIAMRMPGDEADILSPRRVHWQLAGPVVEVLTRVLALPEDHTPGSLITSDPPDSAPARGCWVSGGRGDAKWLPAS